MSKHQVLCLRFIIIDNGDLKLFKIKTIEGCILIPKNTTLNSNPKMTHWHLNLELKFCIYTVDEEKLAITFN